MVCEGLAPDGHEVGIAADGCEGLRRATSELWDLLIVDRMLPGLDGLTLVRRLRASAVETPVLFLTTLNGIDDRVMGLRSGADDYLAKPYAVAELAARVEALGRRARGADSGTCLAVADLEVDRMARTARRAGEVIDLQPREYQLLEYLIRHAGQIVTRAMLLEAVWDFHFDPRTNLVESHISRLRSKIDRGGKSPEIIHTVRNAGYRLAAPA